MIYEILTQHVEPEKRDEYIRVFGDILKKANYAGSHGINFFDHTTLLDNERGCGISAS
jgi:hypothetical protein